MGCACKDKQEKVLKMIPGYNANNEQKEIKGIRSYLVNIGSQIWYFFIKLLFVIVIAVVLMPLIIFLPLKMIFNIPFNLKLSKGMVAKLKEVEEQYE